MGYVASLLRVGLAAVTVGGRCVYDTEQLVQLGGSGAHSRPPAIEVVDALVGRVWSAYFSANKPRRSTTEELQTQTTTEEVMP